MTTKKQEREALEQIWKIVEKLGADSYVATAFEGCFEIAETNIENDWACSMKQRAESAAQAASKMEVDNINLRSAIKKAKKEASKKETELQEKLNDLCRRALTADDLTDCEQLAANAAHDAEEEMKAAALKIVTFADAPESLDFKNAVTVHRAMQSRLNYLRALRERIERAQEMNG